MAVGHYDVCYVLDRPICPIRTSQTHAIPSFRRKRENDPIALEILILVHKQNLNQGHKQNLNKGNYVWPQSSFNMKTLLLIKRAVILHPGDEN